VVEALRCTMDIQRVMAERNAQIPVDRRIAFRIGINIGDVVEQDGDLLGDGVNVAARLEGLSEPGGFCLSRAARDQVRDRLDIALEDMGEVQVKNIARPVRVFKFLQQGASRDGGLKPLSKPARRWLAGLALAAMVVMAIIGGGGFWWFGGGQTAPTDPPVAAIHDGKPSIAVLPLDNLSTDKEQEYFADGMSEDIITDLSKISGLVVIARNSSFQFKGQKFDIKDIARKLGVRYVLEGSIRRSGDQVRINVQLIDGANGAHLWAERYDGALEDIFALQDKVTAEIVSALAVTLTAQDKARTADRETESVAAHDAFLRGWAHFIQTTPRDYVLAIPFFEQALARDPNYGRAHAALAALYFSARDKNWHKTLEATPDAMFEQAIAHRDEALKRPTPLAYQVGSAIALEFRKHDQAIEQADKAIALDANDPAGYMAKARGLVLTGRPGEAVPLIEQAMRLDPNYSADVLYHLGLAKFGIKDYPSAAAALRRGARLAPQHPSISNILVATLGYMDAAVEAAPIISKLRDPAFASVGKWRNRINASDISHIPYRRKEDGEHLREGLRRGGLPEFTAEWDLNRANRLSADMVRAVSFGQTQVGYHVNSNLRFTIHRDRQGKMTATGLWKGTGTSRIIGDRICNYWDKYETETCMVVYQNPNGSAAAGNDYILVQHSGSFPFTLKK
ncbi:MAG: hypothetical protein HN732_13760, partial [Rhodospirillaceae bacterium]|nr:hypothetical protein [Rhodospirillaceae bacterium]